MVMAPKQPALFQGCVQAAAGLQLGPSWRAATLCGSRALPAGPHAPAGAHTALLVELQHDTAWHSF
jgi:hypothetical protein